MRAIQRQAILDFGEATGLTFLAVPRKSALFERPTIGNRRPVDTGGGGSPASLICQKARPALRPMGRLRMATERPRWSLGLKIFGFKSSRPDQILSVGFSRSRRDATIALDLRLSSAHNAPREADGPAPDGHGAAAVVPRP
jgi:hypothetical protein